jgi:hypothetical protein
MPRTGHDGPRPRKHLGAARVGAPVLLLAVLVGCSAGDEPSGSGPVAFVDDPQLTQTSGILADAGDVVVFGATYVQNTGDAPATLLAAELDGDVPDDSAEVVEVRALDPAEQDGELIGAGPWPFEDYAKVSEPLDGYRLPAGAEAELLLVVKVHRTGTWHWPRTRVTYRSDGESFEDSTTFGFRVCPASAGECLSEES